MRKHRGQFPRNERELRSLPGIGDYTARAILSIAYNLPYAVLDGNVSRVVAQLRAVRGKPRAPDFRRHLGSQLDHLLSRRSPGNFKSTHGTGPNSVLAAGPAMPRLPLAPLVPRPSVWKR